MKLLDDLKAKLSGGNDKSKPLITTVATQYEINLVPEVKLQMIKAQKLRNLVLYVCILVSAVSVGVVVVLFGIKSGQDIAMANQDGKLGTLSAKLMGYEELGDLVTIQAQLDKLSEIQGSKRALSRVFGAMNVMLPQGGDSVQLSDLRVDFTTNVLRIEGQADARIAPLIDYRVLESFKKGVALTKYDYGNYVDYDGNTIPAWCMVESDADGSAFRSGENYYAWWDLSGQDCAAHRLGEPTGEDDEEFANELVYSKDAEVETVEEEVAREVLESEGVKIEEKEDGTIEVDDDSIEVREREGGEKYFIRKKVTRVKVWRTPQFDKWFAAGLMTEDGAISNIEHFESEGCIKYSGTMQAGDKMRWSSDNICLLAPDGLEILSSSNGRDASENLVLRFTASMNVAPEFFAFSNKHMVAIGPMGQNVTDSYVQIDGMFTEEAHECEVGDTECLSNASNTGGGK